MGQDSFYAKAPRISDWKDFKRKLLEMETMAPQEVPSMPSVSPEMQKEFAGFDKNRKDQRRVGGIKRFIRYLFGLNSKEAEQGASLANKRSMPDSFDDIEETIKDLMAQDAEVVDRGEIPERRLIPHHAIKRDIIIAAYTKDYKVARKQVQAMNFPKEENVWRLTEMQKDFDGKIYGIKRLGWQDLDKIIALMKNTRTDFEEIEQDIRSNNALYKNLDFL